MNRVRRRVINSIVSVLNRLLLFDVFVNKLMRKEKYFSGGVMTPHYLNYQENVQLAISRTIKVLGRNPYPLWKVVIYLYFVAQTKRMQGDYVELGVGKGFMSRAALEYEALSPGSNRRFLLFDKFTSELVHDLTGDIIDGSQNPEYALNISEVEINLAQFKPRIQIIPGVLPESITLKSVSKISFLHIDLNAANPETACLKKLWDLIEHGGIIILDDYCHAGRRSQFVAMNQLAQEIGFDILSLPTGQGLIMKH